MRIASSESEQMAVAGDGRAGEMGPSTLSQRASKYGLIGVGELISEVFQEPGPLWVPSNLGPQVVVMASLMSIPGTSCLSAA